MSEGEPAPKRVRISEDDLKQLSKDELIAKCCKQDSYINDLESKTASDHPCSSEELAGLRESEEKLKQQQHESTSRERVLVMRLTTKEQEMQEYASQITELKQNATSAQLRSVLLDPAINILFHRMKKDLEESRDKLEEAQNEMGAWKFTPDSQTGKKLMSRCRQLIQENQELGRQLSQGRIAQLEAELALQKKYSEELKSSQDELNDFVIQLDEEVEGMQSTIQTLQQQLKEAKQQVSLDKSNTVCTHCSVSTNHNTVSPPTTHDDRTTRNVDSGSQNNYDEKTVDEVAYTDKTEVNRTTGTICNEQQDSSEEFSTFENRTSSDYNTLEGDGGDVTQEQTTYNKYNNKGVDSPEEITPSSPNKCSGELSDIVEPSEQNGLSNISTAHSAEKENDD
uniref:Pre-mRNA-splicing regulator WTAP-like n=1 Tax=Saccoglossus kowalevskii TaxID=10224 RepID=A0ABM0MZ87_SACKO|nr:PREDICTED: pre-mRNA-splicing regulator WTAP-like [Saccoglossus kowalevskii]